MTAAPAQTPVEVDLMRQLLGLGPGRNEAHPELVDLEGAIVHRLPALGPAEPIEQGRPIGELEIEDALHAAADRKFRATVCPRVGGLARTPAVRCPIAMRRMPNDRAPR